MIVLIVRTREQRVTKIKENSRATDGAIIIRSWIQLLHSPDQLKMNPRKARLCDYEAHQSN